MPTRFPHYSPFGSCIQELQYAFSDAGDTSKYRFGFNGKESDSETGLQDYGFRIYNTSLARFLSVDPITNEYPMLTPYQFASNSSIMNVDLDGLEAAPSNTINYRTNLANVPPPGGAPYMVFEYQRIGNTLLRREHYFNIDPNSPNYRGLMNRQNNFTPVSVHPSGNVLWQSIAGHRWEQQVNVNVAPVIANRPLIGGNLIIYAAGAATMVPALTVNINGQIARANAATAALNIAPAPVPVLPAPVPLNIAVNPAVAPGSNATTSNVIVNQTIGSVAVNINWSVTMTVQAASPFFVNEAANLSLALGGIPVNINVNPMLNPGISPTGVPFNPLTDYTTQLNYTQSVTTTTTTSSITVISSNFVSPINQSTPGNP